MSEDGTDTQDTRRPCARCGGALRFSSLTEARAWRETVPEAHYVETIFNSLKVPALHALEMWLLCVMHRDLCEARRWHERAMEAEAIIAEFLADTGMLRDPEATVH